ncbi:MAG: sulfatase-like hydrolase/transferase [Thermoanaerobaculia bacterium]
MKPYGGILLALLLAGCGGEGGVGVARLELPVYPPGDVVVLSFDALRADEIAGYGAGRDATPAFARLAAESILFEDVLSAAGSTPTAFAALWSGRWPHRTFIGWRFEAEPTLAELFRNAGYRTALFADNVQLSPVRKFDRGFDVAVVERNDADESTAARDHRLLEGALEWLAEKSERPSLLWIHLLDPHAPYSRHARLEDRYRAPPVERFRESSGGRFEIESPEELVWLRELYRGEVAIADEHLGRLLDWLDERGRAATTTLVVTADHGEQFGEHGGVQHGTLYAEVTTIPLFLRLPDRRGAGSRSTLPFSQVDLLPTLAALHGVRAPQHLDGIDWLAGGPRDRIRLAEAMTAEDHLAIAASDGQYDLISRCEDSFETGALFDRRRDPRQTRDLAAEEPERYLALARRLRGVFALAPCAELARANQGAVDTSATSPAPAPAPSAADAERSGLSPEELAGLQALGYLGGSRPPAAGAVRIWFEPDPLPLCEPGGFGIVKVRWSGAGGPIAIEVGAEGKVFATGGPAGEAVTGPWANSRTVFTVRDLRSERMLVARAPGVVPCSAAAAP